MVLRKVGCLILLALASLSSIAQHPDVNLSFDKTHVAFSLGTDLAIALANHHWQSDTWKTLFQIYTEHEWKNGQKDQILGDYTLTDSSIVFRPLFPFAHQSYYARLCFTEFHKSPDESRPPDEFPDSRSPTVMSFFVGPTGVPNSVVDHVFPDRDTLPSNTLRFYVCFSNPMAPNDLYSHIHLTEDGRKIDTPFLVVDQELWDSERKRLTLLFDPSKIKRGLRSNLELGSPLKEGRTYKLTIDSSLTDESGLTLARTYTKSFVASKPDYERPSLVNWKITEPLSETLAPIVIAFGEPMDHNLLHKYIAISYQDQTLVAGQIYVDHIAMEWALVPEHKWIPGKYKVLVSPLLEDLSGNNFSNEFDVDLEKNKRVYNESALELPFTIIGSNHNNQHRCGF